MKKCPTCDKTFDDNLRFCQTDGTPLVTATAATEDPYKTMVASQDEISAALPIDPFATMVGGMPLKLEEEEEVLELPDEPESLKPPVFSQEDIKTQIKTGETDSVIDAPPSPFDSPPPTYPPAVKSSGDLDSAPPPPPKFNEPSVHPPSFGDMSSPKESLSDKSSSTETAPPFKPAIQSPFDKPASPPSQSPFDKPQSPPIPSPFDKSMPPGYHPPTTPPFAEPAKPSAVGQDSFNESPFGQPQPLEQQSMQPATWSPPPAPDANWQNQQIGQNTPFQPPVAAGSGQNNTLAIVSLVLGILSIPCCGFIIFGIAALVTGFMAKSKADQNPNEYGGRGLALGGIILGGITIVLGIIANILYFLGIIATGF